MTIKILCPELTDGQLKALERLISEEVIGSDDAMYQRYLVVRHRLGLEENQKQAELLKTAINKVRDNQRKALTALLWGSGEAK